MGKTNISRFSDVRHLTFKDIETLAFSPQISLGPGEKREEAVPPKESRSFFDAVFNRSRMRRQAKQAMLAAGAAMVVSNTFAPLVNNAFAAAPTVVTKPATSITYTGAYIWGDVTPNGTSGAVSFDWGSTVAYGLSATAGNYPPPPTPRAPSPTPIPSPAWGAAL
jgi:hypothetical protein